MPEGSVLGACSALGLDGEVDEHNTVGSALAASPDGVHSVWLFWRSDRQCGEFVGPAGHVLIQRTVGYGR